MAKRAIVTLNPEAALATGSMPGRLRLPGALNYAQYRNFWLGSLLSNSAQQIMTVAQGWLIYDLTGSPLYLGYAGLATAFPALILSLVGGVLADRVDLRRLLFWTQVFSAGATAVLAALTAAGLVQPWHILIIAFTTGAAQAFNNPVRQSILPYLVQREALMSAVSLNSLAWQGNRIIAPALGGILVALTGAWPTFFVCTAFYILFAAVVLTLRLSGQVERQIRPMADEMKEGVRFVAANALFACLIGLCFFNSFFGVSLLQIMPAFARSVLGAGPTRLGFMFSAVGLGSVAGLLCASVLGGFKRKGLLIVGGATAYGLCLIFFSLSRVYAVSLAALFVMGAFNQVYMISIQTTLQLRVPDQLRGRVMGIFSMTYNMGPLGALQAGAIASVLGAPTAVAMGGAAIIALALAVQALSPEVRSLEEVETTV